MVFVFQQEHARGVVSYAIRGYEGSRHAIADLSKGIAEGLWLNGFEECLPLPSLE